MVHVHSPITEVAIKSWDSIPVGSPVTIGPAGNVLPCTGNDPWQIGVAVAGAAPGEECRVLLQGPVGYPPDLKTPVVENTEEELFLTDEEIWYLKDMMEETLRSCKRPDGGSDLDPGELELVQNLLKKLDS